MNNPDQDTLVRAVEDARRILGEYIEPEPRDATRTVERLLAVLDRNDVVHALDRINRRRVIRLVWSDDQPAWNVLAKLGGLVLTDQELIIFALKDAGRIIAEHLEAGRTRDPEETVTRLIRTLDRPEISRAIERLERGLHVVKWKGPPA
jgi:hypothetical protein